MILRLLGPGDVCAQHEPMKPQTESVGVGMVLPQVFSSCTRMLVLMEQHSLQAVCGSTSFILAVRAGALQARRRHHLEP